ncbi:MAG TPA: hypothetical protein VME17_19595 [Bryobacteraceae bacterium]|nr:hypothetical protein [Bryobacteraceae bacterium]
MSTGTIPQSGAASAARTLLRSRRSLSPWWIYVIGSTYALLVILTALHHEPWADEAQAWLLGRDASLGELWGRLLHYEGSPGIWQTLVHVLARLGASYSAYRFLPAVLAFAAVYLLIRYAPLPLFIRLLLPFTYYLCYQYAVVARSYALIAPLLFAIAALYTQASRRPVLVAFLLCLLAGVSVHGFIVSAAIWATLAEPLLRNRREIQAGQRGTLAIAGVAYWLVLAFFALCAWPARDVAFAEHRGFANLHFATLRDVIQMNFAGAFTGDWLTSFVVVALSAPFLWRGGGWILFLLTSAGLCLFGTLVYTQVWHFGILFLAWLFAIWISAYKTRLTPATLLALMAAIGFQCYWTVAAVRYDWTHAYSGSRAAAEYLRATGVPAGGVYAVGYSSTALQPYFSSNIYSDFHGGAGRAYWDWSQGNPANDPDALFASTRRDMVVVGYTEVPVEQHWAELLGLLGYIRERHFEGGTFWQNAVFERESFDLYRRISAPHAIGSLKMADAAHAGQLLSGFYPIEAKTWRWTAKNFSVLLMAPPGSASTGADLTLRLFTPDAQFQRLGAMTLGAAAGGHTLPAHKYDKPGGSVYTAHVPAEALRSGFIAVKFRLDKAAVNVNGDARELGVIVTAVSLDPAR